MSYEKFQDTSISKTLLVQILLVVIVAGSILFFEKFFNESPSPREGEAALLIDFDNMQRMFVGEVVGKMTILDALNASINAGQIKLTYHVDGSNNTKIVQINDHVANKYNSFTFYINSQKIDPSKLNKTFVQPGDKITIKLE